MKTTQEVGLRYENFVVGFKVGARRAGPRAAALHLDNALPMCLDIFSSLSGLLGHSVCEYYRSVALSLSDFFLLLKQ